MELNHLKHDPMDQLEELRHHLKLLEELILRLQIINKEIKRHYDV